MTKKPARKCPYIESAESNKAATWVQCTFLAIAYFLLIKSVHDFNPTAVIIYIGPPSIELIFRKSYSNKKFMCAKAVVVAYSVLIICICFLTLSGAITDSGLYYVFLDQAVTFRTMHIKKSLLAGSLIIVITIPALSSLSRPEKNDDTIVRKYQVGGVHS